MDVFPGIRYTGRPAGDALGQMTLGEGTIIDDTGVQRTLKSKSAWLVLDTPSWSSCYSLYVSGMPEVEAGKLAKSGMELLKAI